MRYFLHIAFSGTQYRGWQRVPGIVSVQETIESALTAVLNQPLEVVGCGRTDAQVHASQYFLHVDVEQPWDFDLKFRLNKRLPHNIAVHDVIAMEGLPHARFDAFSRSYDYFMHGYKDPFLHPISSYCHIADMDIDKMRRAVDILPLYNDYFALCKSPLKNEHTICNVSKAKLYSNTSGDRLRLHISSNRFLGGMIRIIVGRLLEIGSGIMTVEEFEAALRDKKTPRNIKPALPNGLFLSKVTYPYLDLPMRTPFTSLFHPDGGWI